MDSKSSGANKSTRIQECEVDQEDDDHSLMGSDLYDPESPNVFCPTGIESASSETLEPHGVTHNQQGQSEVITSTGGRRYVAQFFEQTSSPDENAETLPPSAADNPSDDSHMAKALCINLLTELVKGSYQLLKSSTPSENEQPSSKALQHQIAASYERMQRRIDVAMNSADESSSAEEGETSSSNKTHIGSTDPTRRTREENEGCTSQENCSLDFKKATHSWQIKSSQGSNRQETSSNVSQPVNHERKRTIDSAESDSEGSNSDNTKPKKQRKSSDANNYQIDKQKQLLKCDDSISKSRLTLDYIRQECRQYQEKSQRSRDLIIERPTDTQTITSSTSEATVHDSTSSENDVDKSFENPSSQHGDGTIPTLQLDSDVADASSEHEAPELTQLEKIQKHHMAKAIVDNAINKTLDEMALGPRDRTYFSSQRQRIEDAGVSQVISARGLRSAEMTHSTDNPQLQPFINQLTQASEDMFVETLGSGTRFSTSVRLPPNQPSIGPQPPLSSAASFFTRPTLSERVDSYTLTEERGGLEQSSQNTAISANDTETQPNTDKCKDNVASTSKKTESDHISDTCSSHSSKASSSRLGNNVNDSPNLHISCSSQNEPILKQGTSEDSVVLERALETVIYGKGLQL